LLAEFETTCWWTCAAFRDRAAILTSGARAGAVPAEAGIGYTHEPDLGGRRDPSPDSLNTAWRVAAFRGYADHMASPEFRAGVERVLALDRKPAGRW
jgi:hypothetical protein